MQSPIVSNVIGVGQLQINSSIDLFDLQFIASKMEGSRLNAKKFSGLIIRKTKPKGTIILFRSGKFIIVGAQNSHNCQILSKKLPKDLQKILSISGISTKAFRISNMIANGNIGYAVNIPRIAQLPNAFKDDKSAGVFMRIGTVKCVVVFQSGKVILNGATQMTDIQETFEILVRQLQDFKLKNQQKFQKALKPKEKRGKRGKKKSKEGDISNEQPQSEIQQKMQAQVNNNDDSQQKYDENCNTNISIPHKTYKQQVFESDEEQQQN